MSNIYAEDDGWGDAEEHGGKLEEWIEGLDSYSHELYLGRDDHGRFNTNFDSRHLLRIDD